MGAIANTVHCVILTVFLVKTTITILINDIIAKNMTFYKHRINIVSSVACKNQFITKTHNSLTDYFQYTMINIHSIVQYWLGK